jgi:hypothetical protein
MGEIVGVKGFAAVIDSVLVNGQFISVGVTVTE